MFTRDTFSLTRHAWFGYTVAIGAVLGASGQALAQKPVDFEDPRVYCTVSGSSGTCSNSGPNGLAIADIMGTTSNSSPDGLPDVVICNGLSSSISDFRNRANWSSGSGLELAQTAPLPGGVGEPYDVELADIDCDSDLDALVSVRVSTGNSKLAVFLNPGTGEFASVSATTLSTQKSYGLTAADFDGDGDKDILIGGQYLDTETLGGPQLVRMLNNGSGSFTEQLIEFPEISTGGAADVLAVNVNPPTGGRLDVIMSTLSPNGEMIVMYNDGGSDMSSWVYDLPSAVPSAGITFGRLRPGDPRDIALSDNTTTEMRVCWKDTATPPSFALQINVYEYEELSAPWGLDMGTLNRDSANDVVLALAEGSPPGESGDLGGIVVFLGKGDGTFFENDKSPAYFAVEPPDQTWLTHAKYAFVRIADMDDDGINDVVTSNRDTGSLSVLINDSLSVIPPG